MSKYIFAGGDYDHRANIPGSRGGLFRRDAEGGDWKYLTGGLPEQVQARSLAVHPKDRNVLFVGTHDGPYRSIDAGETWERLDFPDRSQPLYSIVCHPTWPNVIYAGCEPAMYRSIDTGNTWKRVSLQPPDHCHVSFPPRVIAIAVDPSRPDDVYVGLEIGGILLSRDGGETFQDISAPLIPLAERPHLKSRSESETDAEGLLDTHAIAVSPALPATPFLASRMGIFRGDDHGATWTDLEIGRFSPMTYCRGLVVSPHDPRTMYACLSPGQRSYDGSLYCSNDAGNTWRRMDHDVKAGSTMTQVAVDRDDPKRVYCASRNGKVFSTYDGGASWTESILPADVLQRVRVLVCN